MADFVTDASGNNAERTNSLVSVISEDTTLTAGDSGKTFLVGTDALTITLPATKQGVRYTFINSGTDGNNLITLSPNANDAIFGSISNAASDSVSSGAVNKNFVNTKATANKGDRITLVGDGVDGWYITEGVGIWASQA